MTAAADSARWPDDVDELLDSDLTILLASVTPAKGVVMQPLTNFALRDRQRGTYTLISSVGAWKKLNRIRRDPHVAVAFHTREHGFSARPEYVLLQGTATVPDEPDRAWLESIGPAWERFAGPREHGWPWDWWQRVYHWERLPIQIAVTRVVVWPDLECTGTPRVYGDPLPADPPAPQKTPAKGAGPRASVGKAAKRARRLPDTLLGWAGADGLPFVVPVSVPGDDKDRGLALSAPNGLVPAGGRRAGLTSHAFTPQVLGQEQHVYTGWLEAGDDSLTYAPHTTASYRLPANRYLYRFVTGAFTRYGLRGARRAGIAKR